MSDGLGYSRLSGDERAKQLEAEIEKLYEFVVWYETNQHDVGRYTEDGVVVWWYRSHRMQASSLLGLWRKVVKAKWRKRRRRRSQS